MGAGPRARQTTTHERDHDVHVRQLAADLQYHDGLHVVQESHSRPYQYESGLHEVRDGGHQGQAVDDQGDLCDYAVGGAELGDMESQWDGTTAVGFRCVTALLHSC
jgi:hypothetical protein